MTVVAEPLREAILGDARAEAERVLARADEQAAEKLRRAEERGRMLVEQARAEGVAAAAIAGAHEEARARRTARAAVLAAQLGLYEELEVDPPRAGGVRASSGARHVDYTLDALVERCLERLGAGVEELWR